MSSGSKALCWISDVLLEWHNAIIAPPAFELLSPHVSAIISEDYKEWAQSGARRAERRYWLDYERVPEIKIFYFM